MQAGFGVSNITPRVGVELYGFGPFLCRQSKIVRDDLEARSVALECGGQHAVIITCDLCKLPEETVAHIRQLIQEKFPFLSADRVMVQCSHTHSGPATTPENRGWGAPDPVYLASLPWKIAQSAFLALENLSPVTVSSALVPCEHIGLNRVHDVDAPPLQDVLREDWRPARPELTDTACRVIRFDRGDGSLAGFMAYFGCHPVVCSESSHYTHGDYPAIAIHNLMRQFPGSVGLFLQGAAGDVNSCVVHKPEAESIRALDVIAGRFERSIRQGLREARPVKTDALAVFSTFVEFSTKATFTKEHVLQVIREKQSILQCPDADETAWQTRMAKVYLMGAATMLELLEKNQKTVRNEIHLIRLGELLFLGTPFEVMQAIKNDIVAAIPEGIPMVMGLTNGSGGYAPDQSTIDGAAKMGTYESMITPFMAGRLPYSDIHRELLAAVTGAVNKLMEN